MAILESISASTAPEELSQRQSHTFVWLVLHDVLALPAFIIGWLIVGGWLSVMTRTTSAGWLVMSALVFALSLFSTIEGLVHRTVGLVVPSTCLQLFVTAAAGFIALYQAV